jgi:tryptophanyl-tRNA synthetase
MFPRLRQQCRLYSTIPPRVIFSGIQPTGTPHLGNYLGALKNWVTLQSLPSTTIYYSIVDLHAITAPYNPSQLRLDRDEMWFILHAIGIDFRRCVVFEQSAVPGGGTLLTGVVGP